MWTITWAIGSASCSSGWRRRVAVLLVAQRRADLGNRATEGLRGLGSGFFQRAGAGGVQLGGQTGAVLVEQAAHVGVARGFRGRAAFEQRHGALQPAYGQVEGASLSLSRHSGGSLIR